MSIFERPHGEHYPGDVWHRLVGPRLKLQRAHAHCRALRTEIDSFFDGKAGTVEPEYHPETGECTIWYTRHACTPIMWSILIGEVAYNLRTALDQAVHMLVRSDGGTPHRRTAFPVCLSADALRSERSKAYGGKSADPLRGITNKRHMAAITGQQPYKRTDPAWRDPLALIHEINRSDKHVILDLGSVKLGQIAVEVAGQPVSWIIKARLRPPIPLGTKVPIFLLKLRTPLFYPRGVQVKVHIPFVIKFSKGLFPERLQVLPTLDAACDRVDEFLRTIVPGFEWPPPWPGVLLSEHDGLPLVEGEDRHPGLETGWGFAPTVRWPLDVDVNPDV